MRIVDGGAKDKAICLLGGSDELVHHVVVKGAATAKLAALAATDAVANGLGAQLERLGIDALGVELLGDLGESAGGIAVCVGTKRTFITNSLCCWRLLQRIIARCGRRCGRGANPVWYLAPARLYRATL